MAETEDMQGLLERVARLEKSHHRAKLAGMIGLGLLLAVFLARKTMWVTSQRALVAGSFVVYGPQGQRRISVNHKKGDVYGMRINSDEGKMRVLLTVDAAGHPHFGLYDGDPPQPVFQAP